MHENIDAVAAAADAVSKTDHETAVATATATAKAAGEKSGAQAAQERIKAILTHKEAAGRDALASHLAFSTVVTVEDAAAMLAAAPKSEAAKPGSRLDALMEKEQPKVEIAETSGPAAVSAGLAAAVTKQLAKIGKTPLKLN